MNENSQKTNSKIQDFYGNDFVVTPDVLIPRPETEMIIDIVLSLAGISYLPGVSVGEPKISKECRILDVGTGSGCIAITLKKILDSAHIDAVDISDAALNVAKENSSKIGVDVNFFKSDLISNVPDNYDVIIANLPYVDENWDWLDKNALSFEPSLALYADDGGLALIKKLISELSQGKCTYLILEADPCQHESIKKYASDFGLKHIETRGFALLFKY